MSEEETPIYEIETIGNPRLFSAAQIARAAVIAASMNRGKLVLAEAPENP